MSMSHWSHLVHFGIQKTDQVKRRFYWPSWKEDTKRFCRRCAECNEYHRGKLKKQGVLKLGREARLPLDIVYGSPDEELAEDYDRFVERVRERTTAFAEVRENLKRSAERNKRYYDLGVKSKRFEVGQWVLYIKTKRKLRGKKMKWKRQYEGPFLVIRTPSSETVEIQKSAKTRARVVHIDELKEYVGKPPKSWLPLPRMNSTKCRY